MFGDAVLMAIDVVELSGLVDKGKLDVLSTIILTVPTNLSI